ncbi:MAG: hypothetical protein ISN28_07305 [Ectothiorhodospiraceae bacterium AqS1]|nr:hypothetical protein [Ectothiorhodospiraceae bacterium AqS1]
MSDFPATKNDAARAAPGFGALRANGDRRLIRGDFLAGTGLSFLLVIAALLLPPSAAQSQFIPPAHQSVQEVGPDEGYRKPDEPDNEYLSLINEAPDRLSIHYRFVSKEGECSQRQSEVLAVGSRLDIPFMNADLMDSEQAVRVRYCAEYDDLPIQRLSGYGSCGQMPAGCGGDGTPQFSQVVPSVYMPGHLEITPELLMIEEGMQGTFTVSLSDIPASNVTLSLVRRYNNRDISLDSSSLTFTPDNWNMAQQVTVYIADDADAVDEMDIITIIAQGDDYANGEVRVEVSDKDKLTGGAYRITGVVPHGENYKITVVEGEPQDITIALVSRPTETVTTRLMIVAGGDITVEPSQLVFTASDWDMARTVTIAAPQDEGELDGIHEIVVSSAGGNYTGFQKTITVNVEDDDHPTKPPAPSGPATWQVQSQIFAIPPTGIRDQAVARIRCLENDRGGCRVYLDCTDEAGQAYTGNTPPIESGSTLALTSRDIVNITQASWEGKGRLACAIRSELPVSAQIWTRSGNAVLVSNNEYISSHANAHHRHVAGIYSIPSPDSSQDISNIRIRCAPESNHCTNTMMRCFDDEGNLHEATIGTIRQSVVRFMQTQELSEMIDHRWQGMGLSCEVESDSRFTVQVLTRTGGGALINNSAQAAAPDYRIPLMLPGQPTLPPKPMDDEKGS